MRIALKSNLVILNILAFMLSQSVSAEGPQAPPQSEPTKAPMGFSASDIQKREASAMGVVQNISIANPHAIAPDGPIAHSSAGKGLEMVKPVKKGCGSVWPKNPGFVDPVRPVKKGCTAAKPKDPGFVDPVRPVSPKPIKKGCATVTPRPMDSGLV